MQSCIVTKASASFLEPENDKPFKFTTSVFSSVLTIFPQATVDTVNEHVRLPVVGVLIRGQTAVELFMDVGQSPHSGENLML